ncbi:hypothetical protein F3Y22_tig00110236pilonHSYRG00078 [Hibiscus syriacus]|uniref:DYW domain-containing protein n=1 Tax=Hibiscus syriacus TaxID=106335 RepID=A0A6A3BAV7_HIBSY|nr:hypothetical protein F3Y22_tig00110236pilonHSYRG00078 [Hibiscus syriacus]
MASKSWPPLCSKVCMIFFRMDISLGVNLRHGKQHCAEKSSPTVLPTKESSGAADEIYTIESRQNRGTQIPDHHPTPTDAISKIMFPCSTAQEPQGRSGKLEEAYAMIKQMPFEPHACVWGALLSSYAVRDVMRSRSMKKNPGCSWIEIKNRVYMLLAGDKSNPQMTEIIEKLHELSLEMKKAGYLPNTNLVLQDVDAQDKEQILCGHSEKLAVAFGLLNTPPGSPLQIIKNLRICGALVNVGA